MKIALISVYSSDQTMRDYYYTYLYALLAQRKPYQNISHEEMPTYTQHQGFINSKPYKEWFIIYDCNTKERVGSIYLSKENEIGIFLADGHQKKGYGRQAVKELMEYFRHVREFKANIAPLNSGSICFFVNLGFNYSDVVCESLPKEDGSHDIGDIIQYVYKITNPFYVEDLNEYPTEPVASK